MTITHEVEREEVMAYLDGELPAARALTVRAHIDECVECRVLADELRQVSSGLSAWSVEPAPERVVAPAAAPRTVLQPRRPWFRWPLAAAAAIGVIAVFITWSTVQRRPASPAVVNEDSQLMKPAATRADSSRGLGYASGQRSASGQGRGFSVPPDPLQIVGMTPGVRSDLNGQLAGTPAQTATAAQLIVRTASVSLSTEKFDDMRASLERVAAAHQGSVAALTVAGDPPNHRSMRATLRVPIAELDAALGGIRALGRVLRESQSSEDITDAHRDLAIRIANSKTEETRLAEILKSRTGRLSDVLAVEQAQSRVRTEIEQMEAQELAMRNRAALSTISVEIDERYRAELADSGPLPIGARLRNAVVDGARAAVESLVGVALGVLGAAPTLVLWAALLFLPVRWLIRRARRVRMFSAQ